MKKTAQLLVNHLKGEKTPESKQIIKKIAGMLKEFGFQGPIKITKVSGILDLDDPVRDAYLKLGIIGENEDDEQIVIFTQQVIKFNIERVKEYIGHLNKLGLDHCIIIYTDSITPMTKKLVKNAADIKIELFTQEAFLVEPHLHPRLRVLDVEVACDLPQ